MKRVPLESGRWFDSDKATVFKEATWWDGHNHVSCATGDQFAHEQLYCTSGGKWILESWSQWQRSRNTFEEISDKSAAAWLVKNGEDPHPSCAKEYAELEIV
jgi:hypothetical protein